MGEKTTSIDFWVNGAKFSGNYNPVTYIHAKFGSLRDTDTSVLKNIYFD